MKGWRESKSQFLEILQQEPMESIAGGIPEGIIRKYFEKNNPGSIAKRILENKTMLGNFLEESNQEFMD